MFSIGVASVSIFAPFFVSDMISFTLVAVEVYGTSWTAVEREASCPRLEPTVASTCSSDHRFVEGRSNCKP